MIGALLGLALGGSIATGGWLLRQTESPAVAAEVPKFERAFEPKKRSSSANEEPRISWLAALLFYATIQSAPKR